LTWGHGVAHKGRRYDGLRICQWARGMDVDKAPDHPCVPCPGSPSPALRGKGWDGGAPPLNPNGQVLDPDAGAVDAEIDLATVGIDHQPVAARAKSRDLDVFDLLAV
jgi:hypothetical protein